MKPALTWTMIATLLAATAGNGNAAPRGKKKPALPDDAATEPAPPAIEPPWAKGVAADKQQAARQLAGKAQEAFVNNDYAHAVELYSQALAQWENPAIHFNLAVSYMRLDRSVEAWQHLLAAMAYDGAALDKEKLQVAQTYKQLLAGRLVTVDVESTQTGVEITLDGNLLLTGPGKATQIVLPGAHALVATKPDFETLTKNLTLIGGTPEIESIELKPRGKGPVKLVRRWRSSLPWTIAGVGLGTALLGTFSWELGNANIDLYNKGVAAECPNGCASGQLSSDTLNHKSTAELENTLGISLMVAGGATLVTGLVMLALNQQREVPLASGFVVNASPHDVGVAWLGSF